MKIAWFSDLDLSGSGYLNISIPLCSGLSALGHEVKVSGLGYSGTEHNYPFSIIPARNIQEGLAVLENLFNLWKFDAMVVALDIPLQLRILQSMPTIPFNYIGIMPLESDPMPMTYAIQIAGKMNKAFIISKFGTEEAHKKGVTNAEYIPIGIDTEAWRQPTQEEKSKLRKAYGIEEDTFVVLTVADNQERKLLSKSMEIFAGFAKEVPNSKYVLVTREHNPVGWMLRDYAQEIGIQQQLMIFERGLSFKELWGIYAMSDAFLLTSKAEGLGMPLLEAMAVGLPCLGTNCTGIAELLGEGRGFLIDVDYVHRDPFGNGRRYFCNNADGVNKLLNIYENKNNLLGYEPALEYVKQRTWDKTVAVLNEYLTSVS